MEGLVFLLFRAATTRPLNRYNIFNHSKLQDSDTKCDVSSKIKNWFSLPKKRGGGLMYITFHQPRLDWKKWRVWKVQLLFVIWLVVNTHLVATICSSLSGKWSSTLRNAQVYRYTGIPCYPITTLSPTRPGPKTTWCTTTGRWRAQKVAQLGTEINQRKNYKVTKFGEVVMWKLQIVMRKKNEFQFCWSTWLAKNFLAQIMSMYKSVDIHESTWKMGSNRPRALPWVVVFQSALQSPNPSRAGRGSAGNSL